MQRLPYSLTLCNSSPAEQDGNGSWDRDCKVDIEPRRLVQNQTGHSKDRCQEGGWQECHGHDGEGLHRRAIVLCRLGKLDGCRCVLLGDEIEDLYGVLRCELHISMKGINLLSGQAYNSQLVANALLHHSSISLLILDFCQHTMRNSRNVIP